MPALRLPVVVLGLVCLCALARPADAQPRRELPRLLQSGLVEITIGHLGVPFSQAQLEPGYEAGAVDTPGLGVRLSAGRRLGDRLSAQLVYLRPTHWARYRNLNGGPEEHSVWTNALGATVAARHPLGARASAYGEAGVAVITRHGFEVDGQPAVEDTVYAAPIVGGGLEWQWDARWGLKGGLTWAAGRDAPDHPRTLFASAGLTYRVGEVLPRADRRAGAGAPDTAWFPEHLVQVGVTTDALGFGFNAAMTPIFWQGDAEVGAGATVHYQRNVFHTERAFSLDWGASLTWARSRQAGNGFAAVSVYPLFRWTMLRRGPADLYAMYTLAGPTVISSHVLDGHDVGRAFTFQDLLGVGIYARRDRRLNIEARIGHYSNGNILPRNAGVRLPLTVLAGWTF
jgi:hypothetical protein